MIFGVLLVFILHFSNPQKKTSYVSISAHRSTARSTDELVCWVPENGNSLINMLCRRSVDRTVDRCVFWMINRETKNPLLEVLQAIGRPCGRPMGKQSVTQNGFKFCFPWFCTSVDRTVDWPGTHQSTVQSTDVEFFLWPLYNGYFL
jgi:hypothetical protein